MLEIEIKAYCDNLSALEDKIRSLGGKIKKKVFEKDIYYKHPSRDFAKTDEAFRIRIEDGTYTLTYKGPKIGERAKTRVEEEAKFLDLEPMKNILGKIGFETREEISKQRTIYTLGTIEICLDAVADIGNFAELEIKGEDRSAEKELFALAGMLGLTRFERKSYLELKLEKKPT